MRHIISHIHEHKVGRLEVGRLGVLSLRLQKNVLSLRSDLAVRKRAARVQFVHIIRSVVSEQVLRFLRGAFLFLKHGEF